LYDEVKEFFPLPDLLFLKNFEKDIFFPRLRCQKIFLADNAIVLSNVLFEVIFIFDYIFKEKIEVYLFCYEF